MLETMNTTYDPKLTLKEISTTISTIGIKKANTQLWQLFILGILAGIYISVGAHVYIVAIEQGIGKIVAGACFGIGLVMVVIAGAELFTGNIMMIADTLAKLYSPAKLLSNWIIVYAGNFVGAVACAYLVYISGIFGDNLSMTSTGKTAASIADYKMALSFTEAFVRGIFCNMLVILPIIMSYFSKDIISKVVCIILPVMAFVASGFEHCVANMYLIPAGVFTKQAPLSGFLQIFHNLLPVTLGNIVGGLVIILIHPNRLRQIETLLKKKSAKHRGPGV